MKILKSGIRDVTASDSATVCEPVNLYECTLHDNVFVGPFVEIQRHCVIGAGTRIQSHSFLCEKVTTGKNCFIGHNVTFANDLFRTGKLNPDAECWISIRLGDNVIVGSGSTILTERICSGAVIGAGSVVTKDGHVFNMLISAFLNSVSKAHKREHSRGFESKISTRKY